MAKTVSQIMAELDKSGGYAADRQLLQKQLSALPGQSAAQIKGLDAQLARANDNILQGARSRGLGFSGIPIAEQAQYAATEYAPAVAQVRQSQNEAKRGILGSLNSLSRDMRSQAQSIFENERNFREQRRQFEEQMRLQRENAARSAAASAAAASGPSGMDYLSAMMSSGGGNKSSGPRVTSNGRGGFTFLNSSNKPITAGQYARATGTDIRDVLYEIGSQGDRSAAMYYNLLRDTPSSMVNATIRSLARNAPHIFNGYVK